MGAFARSLNPLLRAAETGERVEERVSRDFVPAGIAIAAVILFIGIGGQVLPQILKTWLGVADPPDVLLTNALLLNIAILLFGWRRYSALNRELLVRRQAESEARELAESDPLTGSRNRRSLLPGVDALLAERAGGVGDVALLLIDLDNFKAINDRCGHKAGDAVLVQAAARIARVLPKGALMARMGGDEFACALPCDRIDRAGLETLADDIVGTVAQPVEAGNFRIDVTVSVGIATAVQPGETWPNAELLAHWADVAMYHAKKSGRDRYAWFEPQMESELRFRNALESGLRQGISDGEFVPYYEQQIDIQSGKLVGFEMLARWKSPQFGIVSPELFIPLAEDLGVIGELSEGLIRLALQDAKNWDDHLTLSVNISPIQLRDPWLAQKLLVLLQESGFPAHRFEIEITESCLHENMAVVRSVIASLKNQGVKISLDDFGTGYSSLAQLRALEFDRLKIDRSFVGELADGKASSELVGAIVALGRGLGLPIVVEGIENAEALAAVKEFGEIKGQGFHYGRPENAESTLHRLLLNAAQSEQAPQAPAEPTGALSVRKAG
ncbi:putative bifunctional diguanylate cyclase/phosphodiesterase [Croceibacterium aestuarii]|uniref:putative bifunctional diguanylate cyclase/phosphodiesterase n=1 Tax=Croceibacterium aestuarii TaxID=3064139 RepID=UPI00272E06CF|nr:EAL domain-containing protein [Croceibacterium sp. D39]